MEENGKNDGDFQTVHRLSKQRSLPLSTATQHEFGVSSHSAISLKLPSESSDDSDDQGGGKSLSPDIIDKVKSHFNPHYRYRKSKWSCCHNFRQRVRRWFQWVIPREHERHVRAGDLNFTAQRKYCDNTIKTSRYSIITFIPLNFFEQFTRSANIYFLVLIILQAIPSISPYGPLPKAIAVSVVIGITAIRQAVDDFFRYRSDQRVNNRQVNLIDNKGQLKNSKWRHIRVGQIVKLENNEKVPADMVLLSCSDFNGLCYVETAELDGENNLKYRQALKETLALGDDLAKLAAFDGEITCESPNIHLSRFTGRLDWNGQTFSLNNTNLLLRGCTLRNTDWAFGVVVYTGRQTKLMKNAGKTMYKRTRVEKRSNKYFLGLFAIVGVLLLASAVFGFIFESGTGLIFKDSYGMWMQIEGISPTTIAILQCLSYLILIQQLLPLTLYTTIEVIQIVLSRGFINGDALMYDEASDTRAAARSTALNEDLGQIEYVFSDKTGTLTQNDMTFNRCSINGRLYGNFKVDEENELKYRVDFSKWEPRYFQPSFKFYDRSLLNDVEHGDSDVREFFLLLSLCHTLNSEYDKNSSLIYKAQSPDEAALVSAARNFGFVFKSRSLSSITLEINGNEEVYQLLSVLHFDTLRKRMSVIVVDPTGRRRLLCKGADTAIFSILEMGQNHLTEVTKNHLYDMACSGLRTLCCASRDIDDEEWLRWSKKFETAQMSMKDREEKIYECCIEIENKLELLGATAVEDKLQKGVPETIANLTNAGIKVWVLTGDKQETAINIGQSCNMLKRSTELIVIDAECYPGVTQQLSDALRTIKSPNTKNDILLKKSGFKLRRSYDRPDFALIINGHSLFHALSEEVSDLFLEVASACQAVICCRAAPLQKGKVVELVRCRRGAMTLAIGDGGNDVNMIRTAHVGVGISGNEGHQAVLASDFSIGQFRFLQRLLLVHGRWNYLRMATFLNFFFYKTLSFALCQFWFGAFNGWSGTTVYNRWFITAYTFLYTATPLLYFSLFEQDANAYYSQVFPRLYLPGLRNAYFNMPKFFLSMFEGILTSLTAFFLVSNCFSDFNYPTGDTVTTSHSAIGVALGTMLVINITVRCCLETSYWTRFNFWPVFSILAVFSVQWALSIVAAKISAKEVVYFGICEAVWSSPNFWLTTAACVAICNLPILLVRSVEFIIKPNLLHRARLLQFYEGKTWKDYNQISSQSSDSALSNGDGQSSLKFRKLDKKGIDFESRIVKPTGSPVVANVSLL